jgi:hypothetical protein
VHLGLWAPLLLAVGYGGAAIPFVMALPFLAAVLLTALAYGPRDWPLIGDALACVGAQLALGLIALAGRGGTLKEGGRSWRIPEFAPSWLRGAALLAGLLLPLVATAWILRRLRLSSVGARTNTKGSGAVHRTM